MTLTYVALGLGILSFLMLVMRGKKIAALQEDLAKLKTVEWTLRDLRKQMDESLQHTRAHLAAVVEGKKVSVEAILRGAGPQTGGGRSEEEIVESIKEVVAANKVAIFMKGTPTQPQCGFSATAVEILNQLKVPYEAVNAVAEPSFRAALSRFSNWPTLPQVFVDGKLVGGTDILKEMSASGELAKVVAATMAASPAPAPAAPTPVT